MSLVEQQVEPQLRQDSRGHWHHIETAPCEECGCPYDYSVDQPGIVWEAGAAIEDECLDPMCDCHVIPSIGLAFELHFQPAMHYRAS